MPIIVSSNGKNAKKIDKTIIEKEDYLQAYIYENPECIPIYDIKENIKLVIVAREYHTDSGPIDALGIDADGDIYVIETKLYKNADKRLVVAQVLDYGASLWSTYTDYSDFFALVEREIAKTFGIGANQKLMDDFNLDQDGLDILYENIRRNLAEGNYKFVVLMDHLYQRLKDLIIYLNQNSQFDIYAVELEYYNYDQLEIVIPKLFGAEVRKDRGVSPPVNKRKWDEPKFFDEIGQVLQAENAKVVNDLYEFFKSIADEITWGTGTKRGSFNPKMHSLGTAAPYTVYTDGILQVNFYAFKNKDDLRHVRDAIFDGFNKIDGIDILRRSIDTFYGIPVDIWKEKYKELIEVIEKSMTMKQYQTS
jgi:hypothetical protein